MRTSPTEILTASKRSSKVCSTEIRTRACTCCKSTTWRSCGPSIISTSGTTDLQLLLQASLLHDVGKLLVSDRVLVKPGPLTQAEYASVQQHAGFGEHILQSHFRYARVAEIVAQHHERWDGTGYPKGVAGAAIDPIARAVAILDVFSAMVADRPYHRGISESAALAELNRCANSQFDPDLVSRFIAWRTSANPPPLT